MLPGGPSAGSRPSESHVCPYSLPLKYTWTLGLTWPSVHHLCLLFGRSRAAGCPGLLRVPRCGFLSAKQPSSSSCVWLLRRASLAMLNPGGNCQIECKMHPGACVCCTCTGGHAALLSPAGKNLATSGCEAPALPPLTLPPPLTPRPPHIHNTHITHTTQTNVIDLPPYTLLDFKTGIRQKQASSPSQGMFREYQQCFTLKTGYHPCVNR